jgi:Domain of unknown function (DUF4124)
MRHTNPIDAPWRSAIVGAAMVAFICSSRALPAQEVYKSVDADGHVVYSDRASTNSASKTEVHVDKPDPAEVARLAKEQQMLKAEDAQRTKQEAADEKAKATQEHNRQAACEGARNKYFHLRDSGRIYTRDADGNRMYYSDEQADAMREQARQAMNTACGT